MSATPGSSQDLIRTTLTVLFIAGFIAHHYGFCARFSPPPSGPEVIVVATWPLMLRLQARLGNRRALALSLMTGILVLAYTIPVALVVGALVYDADRIAGWANTLTKVRLPPLPQAVHTLPLFGARMAAAWEQVAAANVDELAARLGPYAQAIASWFITSLGGLGASDGQRKPKDRHRRSGRCRHGRPHRPRRRRRFDVTEEVE